MYTKIVGKYLYACHNYLKDRKQVTKSFGRITKEEAELINKGETPQRLENIFKTWYNNTLFFHYPHRENQTQFFPTDSENKLLIDRLKSLEEQNSLLNLKTKQLDTLDQWITDINSGKLPNKPSMRPIRFIKEVLLPMLDL